MLLSNFLHNMFKFFAIHFLNLLLHVFVSCYEIMCIQPLPNLAISQNDPPFVLKKFIDLVFVCSCNEMAIALSILVHMVSQYCNLSNNKNSWWHLKNLIQIYGDVPSTTPICKHNSKYCNTKLYRITMMIMSMKNRCM